MCVTPANIVEEPLQHMAGCIGLLTTNRERLQNCVITSGSPWKRKRGAILILKKMGRSKF
jgi:hypothetical protein